MPGPAPALQRPPTAPQPSSSRRDGVGWGIGRTESGGREADGGKHPGLAGDSQTAAGSRPANSRAAGRSCGGRTLRSSDLKFLVARLRVSAFPRPRPTRCAQPGELLTSFFTSVRSSSVRDGAGASMAEAATASLARAAPPRLRAPVSRNQAVTLAGIGNRCGEPPAQGQQR